MKGGREKDRRGETRDEEEERIGENKNSGKLEMKGKREKKREKTVNGNFDF